MERIRRVFAWICVCVLVVSTLPLYAISFFNHPYYDDFGFSAGVHHAWKDTGSLTAVLKAAVEGMVNIYRTWQGNYTVNLITNLQPGVFSEDLYWIANMLLLTLVIGCMLSFFLTVFGKLGMKKPDRWCLASLAVTLLVQFMPDVGEAFYWFNGGIGTVAHHAVIALCAAWCVKLIGTNGPGIGRTLLLALFAVLIPGGSYCGGLLTMCLLVCLLMWLFWRRHAKRWHFALLTVLYGAFLLVSMAAPGNSLRADMIGYEVSPAKTILQSLYQGVGLIGSYIRLPVIAVTLLLLPAILEAAKQSPFRFEHPWLVLGLMAALFCTQLAPPLYSIASIGSGRQINSYYLAFLAGWFLYVYYLAGFFVRKCPELPALTPRRFGALALVCVCLLGIGCLGFKRSSDVLYGIQNMSGPSALLSMLTGEAQQYDREMKAREELLNDETQPEITLKALTVNPAVFMQDQLKVGAIYDVRPSLKLYYGKEAIHLEGEGDVP